MSKHIILFLAANPLGTTELARTIQDELERSRQWDRFELVTRWAVQPLDLIRELRKLKPTVVHFVADSDHLGSLFLQGPDGHPQIVTAVALQETFGVVGASVRLVVLHACYSDIHVEALLVHVDCVVGMGRPLRDDAARAFATGFYGGLAERQSVAAAYVQGCAAISLTVPSDCERPRLVVRAGIDASQAVLADIRAVDQGMPVPAYPDAEVEQPSKRVEDARVRRAKLRDVGIAADHVDREILEPRRQPREGGRLLSGRELSPTTFRNPKPTIARLKCATRVQNVVRKAVAREPDTRFADAPVMVGELRNARNLAPERRKRPRKVTTARGRWWMSAGAGVTVAAAAVVALVVLRAPPPALAFNVAVEHSARFRGDEASVGDTAHITVSSGKSPGQIWIYRGVQLVLRCPGDPRCRGSDASTEVDLMLTSPGTYTVVALATPVSLSPLTGTDDADMATDVAAAWDAGIDVRQYQLTVAGELDAPAIGTMPLKGYQPRSTPRSLPPAP